MDVCHKDLVLLEWFSDSIHSCWSHHWLYFRCAHLLYSNQVVLIKLGFTNIVRFGPGPNGMLRTLGQYMMGSAATFGYVQPILSGKQPLTASHSFFMAIGTTIRTDSSPIVTQAFGGINSRPTILSRQYQKMKAARAQQN